MGQGADGFVGDHAAPIEDFLEFGGGLGSLMSGEKCLGLENIDELTRN